MRDVEQEGTPTQDAPLERSPALVDTERPGSALVWRLLQGGTRDPAAIAAVVHRHPGARAQIVALLQMTAGNQFVIQVMQEAEKLAHREDTAPAPVVAPSAEGAPAQAEDPTVHEEAPKGCVTTDLRRSDRELQRLLEIGDRETLEAAVTALTNASRRREPGQLADEVMFFAGANEYVLSVSRGVTDAMIPALRAQLATLQGEAPADPAWENLAKGFSEKAPAILNVFDLGGDPAKLTHTPVAAARLRYLFTPKQRDLLLGYFGTGMIPEHLFNADDVGQTTAPQRIMIASEILAKGTYIPGSEVQRVHALACYHWARIVYHYAGAATTGLDDGTTGSFDHAGGVLFATGKSAEPVHAKKDAGLVVPDNTPQSRANGDSSYRFANAPWDQVEALQPGDWLYIYNANKSISGAHSVIFAGWSDETQRNHKGRYRTARVYGQSTPDSGGHGQPMLLGDDYFLTDDGKSVHPVNQIKRVNEDAAPATTVDALSPKLSTKAAMKLDGANQAFINDKRKTLSRKGPTKSFQLDDFLRWLREDNERHIATLAATPGRLTPGQVDLLRAANASTDDYDLVCLNQRLVSLDVTSTARESKDQKAGEGKEAARAVANAANAIEQEKLRGEIAAYESELDTVEAELAPMSAHLEEIDVGPEMKKAVAHKRALTKQRQKLDPKTKAAEREQLRVEIAQLSELIKNLATTAEKSRTDVTKLGKKVDALERREDRLFKKLGTAQDALTASSGPTDVYNLVHPGGHAQELVLPLDGRFANLPGVPWDQFFVEESKPAGER